MKSLAPIMLSALFLLCSKSMASDNASKSLDGRVDVEAKGRSPKLKHGISSNWVDLYKPYSVGPMQYRLLKPIGLDSKKKYPVIVSLHGAGGKGADNRKQLKGWNKILAGKQIRTKYACYVLAPQANRMWNATDLKNIKNVISKLPSVDMSRIYILGHSMGGHGTYILIQIDPNYFAAAAPSAGAGRPSTEAFIDVSLIKDLPIWAFHGDKDRVCPIDRAQKVFDDMKRLNGNMKFTIWSGDKHAIAEKMFIGSDNGTTYTSSSRCNSEADFMKWLFAQKRLKKQVTYK
tara:strand:- start:2692 stop:3558 length:867 start_codon:yes stop_codon:yes gene_type:complete